MSAPLPMVGSGEQVSGAVEALEKAGAAVVLVDGRPAGMITPQDLLAFLAAASHERASMSGQSMSGKATTGTAA